MPMLAIFSQVLAYIFRVVFVKAILITILVVLVTLAIGLIIDFIELYFDITPDHFNELLNAIPDGAWYFMELLQFPYGVKVVMIAVMVKFVLRMIPVIGLK